MFFRLVSEETIQHLHKTFNQAFSDYPIPLRFDELGFKDRFVTRMKMVQDLSGLIIIEDTLAGFVFHSTLVIDGKLSAYNCGTGVIPRYRGLQLVGKIYENLMLNLKQRGIDKVYLEVLQNNSEAIRTYQHIGFRKIRLLKSYKLDGMMPTSRIKLEIKEEKKPEIAHVFENENLNFSFQDKAEWIQNSENEYILVFQSLRQTKPSGYAIYQLNGRISRIYVNESERGKGIGAEIIRYIYKKLNGKPLTVMNIDEAYTGIDKFLKTIGFKNELNQWEMILEIPK